MRVTDVRQLQSRYELLREQVRATSAELEELEAAAMPRLQELGAALAPWRAKMIAQRRELLARVEEALCSPEVGTRVKRSLEEIALALNAALQQFGASEAAPTNKAIRPPRLDTGEPIDPHALRKRLYLGLARQLHPDKGASGVQSMQRLNAAYAAQDTHALLELHHAHGGRTATGGLPADLDAPSIGTLCDELEQQLAGLRERRARLLEGLPEFQGPWQSLLENPKRWKRTLRATRIQAEEEVARFKELLRATRELPELIRFAKGLDPAEYGQYF